MRKGMFAALLAGATLAVPAASVLAQSFPSKPIRIIVAFTPGGANDVFSRTIGQKLSERLGQPVIMENKPGASGNIGAEFVARSAPDGYTLLVAHNGLPMLPWVSKSLPFDVLKDFAPIGIGATISFVMVVANKLPVKSINELIAYARANPGKLSYGTPGIATPHYFGTELFMNMTGTKMVHVPYKGGTGFVAALMSGELQVAFGAPNSSIPLIQTGKIRAIGVTGRQRLPELKDLPTVNESLPGFELSAWFGLAAPAGTPDAITDKLSDEQRAIVSLPEVRARLAGIGFEGNPSSAAEMRRTMIAEFEKWGKVAKAAGIQPQ